MAPGVDAQERDVAGVARPVFTAVRENADRGPGEGMTTALISKQRLQTGKARVAWISRQAGALARTFDRRDDELVDCQDWKALALENSDRGFDLVLCDEEAARSMPADVDATAFIVADGVAQAAPVPVIQRSSLEGALDALLALSIEASGANRQCAEMQQLVSGIRTGDAVIGNTPIMRRLQGAIRRAADCDVTVLLEGAPGSGKSLVARVIHCKSRRAGKTLVTMAGGTVTAESLAKSMEAASGSTLIIEDVDRMPAAAQALLVRNMKERSAQTQVARLIFTTSAHLPELVARGAFREDLYYRMHAFPIIVPALRERMEDVPSIAKTLLESGLTGNARAACGFTPSALILLESMQWPGNIAQLEAVIRRAYVAAAGGVIDREHLLTAPPENAVATEQQPSPARGIEGEDSIRPFEEEEKLLLSRALRATKGNVRRAAQLLNIGRATLYRKIQQYQLRLQ